MRITDFEVYRDLLREKLGLILEQDQSYLLDSRLAPIAKKWGYSSLEAMTAVIHGVPDKELVYDIVEAMTIKDTSFNRDAWPFYMFANELLPILKKARASQKKIRIWCAGASTGQESYSLCILFKDKGAEFQNWKLDVLATDISGDALEQAKQGVYSQFEVQRGLSVRTLLKHFKQIDEDNWQISSDLRKMVRYQTFNMLDNMSGLGRFDVILCRNVIGDFAPEMKKKIFDRLSGQLEKDGFLMLGAKEKPEGEAFRPLHARRGVYVHKDSAYEQIDAPGPATLAKSAV